MVLRNLSRMLSTFTKNKGSTKTPPFFMVYLPPVIDEEKQKSTDNAYTTNLKLQKNSFSLVPEIQICASDQRLEGQVQGEIKTLGDQAPSPDSLDQ